MKTYKWMLIYDYKLDELIQIHVGNYSRANTNGDGSYKKDIMKGVKHYLTGKAPAGPHLNIDLDDTDRYSFILTNTTHIKSWSTWNKKEVWVDK